MEKARSGNVDWCVLTNGNGIRAYNASWKVRSISESLLFKLSLNEYMENRSSLLLLSKQSIEKGDLIKRGR